MAGETVSVERWREIERVFDTAADLEQPACRRYLDEACGNDEELRRRVESLLAAEAQADEILGRLDPARASDPRSPAEPFLAEGAVVGPYRVLEKLGEGGMGVVYKAHDLRLDRLVALKLLPADVRSDPERRARLHREARAVAALSHPNIVAVYDLGFHDGSSYVAMELLDGEALDERLLSGPVPPRKAVELASQIADALAAAHERGIVHRDLKPANVFLTRDGRAKVLDFGLARLDSSRDDAMTLARVSDPTAQTAPGTVFGTVGYMSPEQVRGQTVDARSDLFAFGAVLYEMLTGRRAFPGESGADALGAILRDEPPALRDAVAAVPPALELLVHRCLEKRPEDRFQSARDLAFALRTLAVSSAASAPAPAAEPARGHDSRPGAAAPWRTLALVGWLVAIMAAVAAVAFLAVRPTTAPRPPRVSTLTFSGRDWAPSASPDSKLVAFVSDRDGGSRIWLKQLTTGSETPLTEGADDWPRFSPDGSHVLFTRRTKTSRDLYRVPVVGGQPRKVVDDVMEADWSPEGRRVAFVRGASDPAVGLTLGVTDVQSGAERVLGRSGSLLWSGPRWSPDGKWIAVTEGTLAGNHEGSWIRLFDVRSAATRAVRVDGFSGPHTSVEWAPDGRSFIVGRARDLLSYSSGSPTAVVVYELGSGSTRLVLWTLSRGPRAQWGSTTFGLLGPDRLVFDQQVLIGELAAVSPTRGDARSARVLTTGLARDRQPTVHPDGTQVLFASNRSGSTDLWSVDLATGALRQLTDDPADDWDPAYAPDGRGILWSSSRSGHLEIWMADADGSNPRQVSSDGQNAENPTMTADGDWVVYSTYNEEHPGLWKVRPDGSDATLLQPGLILLPETSPDGRYVLYLRVHAPWSSLHVCEVSTGAEVDFHVDFPEVPRAESVILGRARWSPDGTGIFYVDQDGKGLSGVTRQDFVLGEDTSASRRPAAGFSPGHGVESFGVSRDGDTLVVSTMRELRSLQLAEDLTLAPRR